MRKILAILLLLVGILTSPAFAQARLVSGRVTSTEDNTPLPGVNVVVKGSSTGTVTDADGRFSIQVTTDNIIVFSYIGFTPKEVPVGESTNLNVTLVPDVQQLGEVVVTTALGIKQEKRALGYTVTEVKGEEIAQTQRENFLVSLQGRVPGLTMTTTGGQPGASAAINLRGASSIGGNNQPLFVIDGLPIDNRTFSQGALVSDQPNRTNDYLNRAADINPSDFESVTVLKGPEASALYGIDASGGAIVITTKKGRQGRGSIVYDNAFRVEEVFRFPETQTTFGRGLTGINSPNQAYYFGEQYGENEPRYNNIENFFQQGFTQRHNLSFEGGNDKLTYRLSNSYTDQSGTIPTSSFKRLSIRLSATAKITPKLEATSSFNYVNTGVVKPVRGELGFLTGLLLWPSNDDVRNYLNPDGTRRRLAGDDTREIDNPFFSIYKNHNEDRTNRSIGNLSFSYDPIPWLNLTARVGADIYSTLGNYFQHPETNAGQGPGGFVENFTENSQLLNGNLLATVKKNFGRFKSSLLLGTTFDDRRYEVNAIRGERLYIADFNSINNTDPTSQRNKSTLTRQRLVSVLGSFDVSYDDMVYLSVRGRNDWSSTLPVQNNAFFYPSASLSFVFTELAPLRNLGLLSFGKLRASYAQTGKDAPPYNVQARLVPQTTTGGGFAYGFFGGNPDLKPERTSGFEVGTELKFFDNRIGLDFAFYNNTRSKQIVSQRLSYGTGYIFGLINGGSFTNQGIEVQLTGSPLRRSDLNWDITANFTTFTTSVNNLPAEVAEYYNSDTWLLANARASAFPSNLQDFYPNLNLSPYQRGLGSATAIGGWSYLRNDRGNILINPISGLPVINTNFLPIGDRNPDFTLGLLNSFTFKEFSLSFLLDFRKGGDVYNGNELFLFRRGLSTRTLDREAPVVFTGVLRDGQENSENPTVNTIQVTPNTRLDYYSALPEEQFIERDINWMRLRDITLQYRLPTNLLSRQKLVQSASVFVTGTDLFLITNYTGADPNVNGNTAGTLGVGAAGFDFGTLAVPRGIAMGLRISL